MTEDWFDTLQREAERRDRVERERQAQHFADEEREKFFADCVQRRDEWEIGND